MFTIYNFRQRSTTYIHDVCVFVAPSLGRTSPIHYVLLSVVQKNSRFNESPVARHHELRIKMTAIYLHFHEDIIDEFVHTYTYVRICIYESGFRIRGTPPPHGMVPPAHPVPHSTSTKLWPHATFMNFAHATVPKRAFPHFPVHADVTRRKFSFCWMNPLAGIQWVDRAKLWWNANFELQELLCAP